MKDVIKGTNEQNILKLVGRFGFSEGQATNALSGMAASALGYGAGGPAGTIAANTLGQISKKLAQNQRLQRPSLQRLLLKQEKILQK